MSTNGYTIGAGNEGGKFTVIAQVEHHDIEQIEDYFVPVDPMDPTNPAYLGCDGCE